MKILLACSAGTSTSLLEDSVSEYFKTKKIKGEVRAYGADKALTLLNNFDVVLLGPQVAHRFGEFMSCSISKRVACISKVDFIMANGQGIVNQAKELMSH